MKNEPTVRLTVAQAVVRYLINQHSVLDGHRQRFIPAAAGIFGHGNVAGFSQAFAQYADEMPFIQGRNEQALAHAGTALAKASIRRQTLAVTASIGPGAMNLVTAAATATVNRLPLLLLPGDTYATRRQGPVLQELENPQDPSMSVNDAFRPVSTFFDRITRPEQLITSLPKALRVLANPVETGAVVLSLPQDIQSHAFDYPLEMFSPRDWEIRRTIPRPTDIAAVAELVAGSTKPLIIAGGGVLYSRAQKALARFADATGIPVAETFGGKGAVEDAAAWGLGGIGLEGNPATNRLVAESDLIISVGTRLTDFATGSQTMFTNPDVQFASINITELDAIKQGATAVVADARLGIDALAEELAGYRVSESWAEEISAQKAQWRPVREASLDPDKQFDKTAPENAHLNIPDTDAVITQGQLIGLLQEHARPGDTIIAAAGGPPGDLLKVWDATDGRRCHLEFGFSCMGYEIPAGIGVRLADPQSSNRVTVFIGDGTFLMNPTEILTAAQEQLDITYVISENHGFQVIRRLQMMKFGEQFGNDFRYRDDEDRRLSGDYLRVDLGRIAEGLGAATHRATTADEVREVLSQTRNERGPVAVVVPTIPLVDLPGSGVFWDVAPAEVAEHPGVRELRSDYELGLEEQRWHV
ncbi:3D-(3,5/4)-trihydroxycyclohexane-1,2-dione acylhydrolase (decyclizing) [Brevibacterium casei]|uniref:3D-(3,5/4)-trihydroxycyclohexane-1,2-dione acylhydrolase (Decyclizing) n=2 Tax=Brevibacterium casei TaxID=33889 RepID=A0A2H1IRI0_9MICO|nr:3D-(3,5/4)-trihydroxycyclohexane-1,2-dione acylhydrolase (decyclizing) [Brevibacterium casei]QPR39743.1 3D-(3,5/4)-trihydroxycyclohexane-1,2-dione acylhydrolase (decyclizing) [Brevibacterium casei]QPR43907.1 3D-(3,5/4)-trihydroxycyclohexane-1,2-dione acylhydrolase (decyclizing) [Brevibacterium casei]SMX77795.1 3D-(3,5/4)-trihydroxycyclohexane-1,2-dione acylhydrolase (decyclizing) [Brevibacterium casei CIP 102111]VEW15456.1 3D-(3,5/4)-trihydroxycyclohexane-1,2-dione hydrolase [Brevibacterium 